MNLKNPPYGRLYFRIRKTEPPKRKEDRDYGTMCKPLEFDKVKVECFQEIPIQLIANAAKTDFKVIKDLNPELCGYSLDAGRHETVQYI